MSRKLNDWNNLDPNNSKGPISYIWMVFLIIVVASLGIGAVNFVIGYVNDGAQVVREETSPRALLKKYEWFKDASAQLDAKKANIVAQELRLKALTDAYIVDGKPQPRSQWARTDLESFNQITAEVAGMKASFNDLAAQYNAQMVKINFAFTNVGQLPQGASEPLPREFKPYQ
ncbi:MAG: hypothetical protein HY986_07660 [Candidatus Melainabacteria bacterium]|nr:hypothetical protein [Candidatus Melainabacteria bacterium]